MLSHFVESFIVPYLFEPSEASVSLRKSVSGSTASMLVCIAIKAKWQLCVL